MLGAQRATARLREETFNTFAELDAALERELGGQDFDAVIHAAAVSDFSIHTIEIDGVARPPGVTKLPSDIAPTLRLRRNPKLIDTLRERSRHAAVRIVGFKLTSGAEPAAIRTAIESLCAGGNVDLVVHNDLAARGDAFPAAIWSRAGEIVARCADRKEIGPALETLLLQPAPETPPKPAPLDLPANVRATRRREAATA